MSTQTDLSDLAQRALRDGPFSMRQLAAQSGLSYDVLRSWRSGRRSPNPASIARLAAGLIERADALRELGRELKRSSER